MILINLIKALLLTEIVEALTAYLMGFRGKYFYTTLILINLITNPLLNCIIQVLFSLKLLYFSLPTVILLEIFVVIAEWRIFVYALPKETKSLLKLSVVINATSYMAGIFILR